MDKINTSYFQLYTGMIVASSLLDLGFRIYSSYAHNNERQAKVGLAISRTWQNALFLMPIFRIGYKALRNNITLYDKNDPLLVKILMAAMIIGPFASFAYANYIIAIFAFNPVFALGAPRGPKDLTAYFTNSICNIFRALNIATVSILLASGRVSLPSALLATSACLVTMVAQGHLGELP